jgi:hypothetical protein
MKAATNRDVSRLIGEARVDDALACGDVEREKVQGVWLYLTPGASVDEAVDEAEAALRPHLQDWLLNPGHFLIGPVARESVGARLGKPALTLLTHELCARGRLLGLPVLSQSRQVYLAYYLVDDADEISRQVLAMREWFRAHSELRWRDLPEPRRTVNRQAWRSIVVEHAVWLGLGWQPKRGAVRAW